MRKKLSNLFLLLLVSAWSLSATLHKFYVSHYTVDYRQEALQVTVKVFADDLEKVLQKKNPSIRINEKQSPEELGKAIHGYYSHHLQFILDDKARNLKYVGFEPEQDVVYVYLQIPALTKAPEKMEIVCDALTEDFEEEVNLFKIHCGTIQETFFLNKSETQKVLK